MRICTRPRLWCWAWLAYPHGLCHRGVSTFLFFKMRIRAETTWASWRMDKTHKATWCVLYRSNRNNNNHLSVLFFLAFWEREKKNVCLFIQPPSVRLLCRPNWSQLGVFPNLLLPKWMVSLVAYFSIFSKWNLDSLLTRSPFLILSKWVLFSLNTINNSLSIREALDATIYLTTYIYLPLGWIRPGMIIIKARERHGIWDRLLVYIYIYKPKRARGWMCIYIYDCCPGSTIPPYPLSNQGAVNITWMTDLVLLSAVLVSPKISPLDNFRDQTSNKTHAAQHHSH